jgi:hypothetical protein
MTAARIATIFLAFGLAAAMPEFAAAQGREKPAPRPAQAQQPRQENPPAQPKNPKAQAKNQARGDEIFLKLLKMTPDEREKALSVLPQGRREQLERRIENFQNLKPEQQERRLNRVERLNALPLDEQARVRQSTKELQNLPPARRNAVNQELQRMSVMGDDEKQFHMNTEEFRNRFSPAEQEMLGNLTKVY